jgi:lipopolysaccharide/colanic/teichoic acid biosynthesis glycosyltransferase
MELEEHQVSNLIKNSFEKTPYECPFEIAKRFNIKERKPVQFFLKRLIDIIGSGVGLIVLFPFFVLIAVVVKLDSKGPAVFKQKRIGLHGTEFYMYKFRSMAEDAESQFEKIQHKNETNEGMFKMFNDPRITKVGKFLRKFSLDEFPQLYNVLKGEMSLVGFRPPLARELSAYREWHYIRFAMPPGITGLWQISGRSKIKSFDKVIGFDYKYAYTWNLLLDFQILLKTIPVVLFAKNSA